MSTYLIGEIGQNHNGIKGVAQILSDVLAAEIHDSQFNRMYKGWDAAKLTLRDMNYELAADQMNRPYSGRNSFGATYGEHREFLELSIEEHIEIYDHIKSNNLDYVVTLCAPSLIEPLISRRKPDFLKVASRDLTNGPLLEQLAATELPMIISTGMSDKGDLDEALEIITRFHENISILHCVSQYPTEYQNVNLRTISYLKNNYPNYKIGYSDHTIGISIPLAAASLGAEIIEKHVTVSQSLRGTDQAGSLGINGIQRLGRDIRILDDSMGTEDFFLVEGVKSAKEKLERSICTKAKLSKGTIIKEDDLVLLSPGNGIKWIDRHKVIGKKLKNSLDVKVTIMLSDVE
jgi:3-deoxy-D-glycero-D-galacto-nononate 9-phosphate synthase